jgi:hypothetical protein
MRLADIQRNDVISAVAYARQELQKPAGLSDGDARVLYMLQDNPKEYVAAFDRMARELGSPGQPHRPR